MTQLTPAGVELRWRLIEAISPELAKQATPPYDSGPIADAVLAAVQWREVEQSRDDWMQVAISLKDESDRLRNALESIANEDYRGPRPRSVDIARAALNEAATSGGPSDA